MRPLCDVGELFGRSWESFYAKFWRLLAVGGAGAAASFACSIVPLAFAGLWWAATGGASALVWTLAALVSVCGVLWTVSWAQVAMMEVALEGETPLDLAAAYRLSWSKIGPFSWVCVLFFALAAGGLFLFVLPGVAVGVFLALSPFACVAEGRGGFSALERSWAVVEGRFWAVLLRLGLIGLVTTVASAIPVVGFVLGGLAAPFTLVAMAELWRDASSGVEPRAAPSAARWSFAACALGLAVAGAAAVRGGMALAAALPALEARGRSLLDHPLDPQVGQQAIDVLQGGFTPENLDRAMKLIEDAQAPKAPAGAEVGLSTSSVGGAPDPRQASAPPTR